MNPRPTIPLAPGALTVAHEEASTIRLDVSGVSAVVIATVDGFEVAAALSGGLDAPRVAALASSIAAIGDVVSSEARLANPRSVTINTDDGFVLVHSVRRADVDLVISIVASADAVLAQVNYRAGAAARRLAAA